MLNDPVVQTVLVAVAAVLLVVLVVALLVARRRRRRQDLSERFGPEYEHAVSTHGRRQGERELEARREHVEHLPLRDLSAEERSELVRRWGQVQARFVDQPVAAVADADSLIAETMRLRGYPVDEVADDERREADLSGSHPREVGLYRQAAAIARRSRSNQATTEELRQAMVHYRALFETLSGAARQGAAVAEPVPEHRPERPGEGMTEPVGVAGDARHDERLRDERARDERLRDEGRTTV